MTKTTKQLSIAAVTIAMLSMMTVPVFASHGTGGLNWSTGQQKFYCESGLSDLDLTAAVDPACDDITTGAAAWTNLSDPSWAITKHTSSAINQKAVNMGINGLLGEMVPTDIFGTIITAYIKYNTEKAFGDVSVDSNVYDWPTVSKHEIGHLPTLFHNEHSESTSVMQNGLGLNTEWDTITSNDEAAVEAKYP